MLATGADLAATKDPLEAEILASMVVGLWYGHPLIDADPERVLGHGMVEAAARRRTPSSLAFAAALTAVTAGPLQARAAAATRDVLATGVPPPAWLDEVGEVAPTRFFQSTEVGGDATAVLALFSYNGQPEHALSVLIDHNLGGIAKDAWVTPAGTEVVEQYEAAADDRMSLNPVLPSLARALVEQAFERTDRALPCQPPISDELRGHRALALARMRLLPEPAAVPAAKPLSKRRMNTLLDEFLKSPEATESRVPDDDLAIAAELIADYGNRVDVGQPLRVSAVKAELLLTDWLPRFGDLEENQADGMVRALEAWYRWSAQRTGLPPGALEEALAAVEGYGPALSDALKSGLADDVADLLDEEETFLDVWSRQDILSRRTFAVPKADADSWFDRGDADDRAALIGAAHPEYGDALAEGVDEVDGVSPHLHVAMHTIIASQLWADDPPEVWRTAQRLLLGYDDLHEVHHMLAGAMSESLLASIVDGDPYDHDAYLERLAALPGSWEDARL